MPSTDLNLLLKLDQYDRERALMMTRLERDAESSNIKLRDYKHKYNKLKHKLNNQLMEQKREERLQSMVKSELEASKEKDQLSAIKEEMAALASQLRKNSQMLTESIKLKEEMSMYQSKTSEKAERSAKKDRD
jgi:maltodextrin utilization protein YvdJ